MRGLVAAGFAGANVTAPHKLAAFEICDTVEASARRAGAVNTLVFRDGRITGRNTDGLGFVANLRAHGVDPAAGPALVLGAGGAARAVVAALQDTGVTVTVANRTRARADALARDLPGLVVIDWPARAAAIADHALLVNTTSLGMARPPAAGARSRQPRRRGSPSPTSSTCRWRPRCWRRRGRAACARSRGWACCCTRRCPASPRGSA